MPQTFNFLIRFMIPGATEPDEIAVRVYEDERLQDMALMGPDQHGTFDADFERDAESLPVAVLSALHDLADVLPEAQLIRVDNDNLVTIAEIARRLGRSHEYIRLLASGQRGPGNFPAPVGRIDNKTAIWDWGDVAQWWEREKGAHLEGAEDTAFLTLLNDALQMRRVADRLEGGGLEEELAAIADLLPSALKQAVRATGGPDPVAA